MSYQESSESPSEKRIRIFKEKLLLLEEAIEKAEAIIQRHENSAKELNELGIIISGLYKKAKELSEENLAEGKKDKEAGMPETDEEWKAWENGTDAWFARMERIDGIYSKIEDLEKEYEVVEKNIAEINSEFEKLQNETEVE